MSRIDIKDNKKLVLKKVINRELLEIDVQDLDIEINKFYSKLKMLKASINLSCVAISQSRRLLIEALNSKSVILSLKCGLVKSVFG